MNHISNQEYKNGPFFTELIASNNWLVTRGVVVYHKPGDWGLGLGPKPSLVLVLVPSPQSPVRVRVGNGDISPGGKFSILDNGMLESVETDGVERKRP